MSVEVNIVLDLSIGDPSARLVYLSQCIGYRVDRKEADTRADLLRGEGNTRRVHTAHDLSIGQLVNEAGD